MSVIAELSIPVEDFPLGRALAVTPNMQIELERIVPTDTGALPFFWVRGDDVDAFVAELREETDVDAISILDRFEDGALIRATWTATPGFVEGILRSEATLLEVTRYDDVWRFRLRSPDREAVAALQRYCAENDIDLRLDRISSLGEVESGQQYGLTDDQRRTIVTAFEAGYFDDPRGTTLEELGTEFDISPRAVSKRLRRGLRNLVDATLITDDV
ncbi:helix-turn-helix domain-containing protein [Halorussus gelatinilyticus]|uniref:Helix-turn-helix domain-containing protein n=1 Tax=Halorussus gelatinilyticus TaxID=2937524 RepID=A0A8U0IL89_9EURY|nr:helix-turn-helix domain-containing protein [Halorussus gelatinilyticus]UPW00974.1 helix-turn-helix domain-containing protein [Halorussus gelatinilyticus]